MLPGLIDCFPYRNDVRKVLVPYLRELSEAEWLRVSPHYPNSVAWVVRHLIESEDGWIHGTGQGQELAFADIPEGRESLLEAYIEIRSRTDALLAAMSEEDGKKLVHVPAFSDGWTPPSEPTWRWLFHHVYTHEAHHAGQVGVIARLNGFRGPLF
jgi:uncharacterized damage-inducible protein DinB